MSVEMHWLLACFSVLPHHPSSHPPVQCAIYNKTISQFNRTNGARSSSVVRAFAHGVMGRRIDPSWWTHYAISRSSQCSTTGVTRPRYVLSCLWDVAYKRTIAVNRKE